jgi:acyl-CoA thioesterase FadM
MPTAHVAFCDASRLLRMSQNQLVEARIEQLGSLELSLQHQGREQERELFFDRDVGHFHGEHSTKSERFASELRLLDEVLR